MAQFRTREEYDRWKSTRGSTVGEPAKGLAPPADAGFSVAKRKPKLGLVVVGGAVVVGSSAFLFVTGDAFSGAFVLILGASIVGVYAYFKLRPHLDDAGYLKTAAAAIAMSALRHGKVSKEDAETVKRAEDAARARHAGVQTAKGPQQRS